MAQEVIQRLPTSDHLTTYWFVYGGTSKYQGVDEAIGSPDDDDSYIYVSQYDADILFGYSAFNVPSDAKQISVKIKVRLKKINTNGSSNPRIAGSLKIGGEVYRIPTVEVTTTSYSNMELTFSTDPVSGAKWTPTSVASIDYWGVYSDIINIFGGEQTYNRITQMYTEVTYETKAPCAMPGPGVSVNNPFVSAG